MLIAKHLHHKHERPQTEVETAPIFYPYHSEIPSASAAAGKRINNTPFLTFQTKKNVLKDLNIKSNVIGSLNSNWPIKRLEFNSNFLEAILNIVTKVMRE